MRERLLNKSLVRRQKRTRALHKPHNKKQSTGWGEAHMQQLSRMQLMQTAVPYPTENAVRALSKRRLSQQHEQPCKHAP